jgi:hypothetical protein
MSLKLNISKLISFPFSAQMAFFFTPILWNVSKILPGAQEMRSYPEQLLERPSPRAAPSALPIILRLMTKNFAYNVQVQIVVALLLKSN